MTGAALTSAAENAVDRCCWSEIEAATCRWGQAGLIGFTI